MKMIAVNSLDLAAVGYDESTRTLRAELRTGSLFEYYDVPPKVFEGLLKAETPWHFFKKRLYKGPYEFRKLV